MTMHNYSVIIPFKDCTELLRKACSSIPNREDIQILVIDNARMPIGAAELLTWENKNITYLISSPELGAGCARNVGLKHADGKYVLFLDADDYFTDNAFDCFDEYLDLDYDIIYFNALSVKINTGSPSTRHHRIDRIIKNAIDNGNEDGLRYRFDNPVSKMIRRKLIVENDVLFQEVPASNDQLFSVLTGHLAKNIKAVDRVVYIITEGDTNSSLTRTKSLRNQESRFKVDIDCNLFLKSIGRKDLARRINSEIFYAFINFGLKVGFSWMKYAWQNRDIRNK